MRYLTSLLLSAVTLMGCDDAPQTGPDAAAPLDSGALDSGPDGSVPDAALDGRVGDAASDAAIPDATLDATLDAAAPDASPDAGLPNLGLRIAELVAKNNGSYIDEIGEADDWFELVNHSNLPIELSDYSVSDAEDAAFPLPAGELAPWDRVVFFADDQPEQGDRHFPFKLSASGETLYLFGPDGLEDSLSFPRLAPDETFARLPERAEDGEICQWATPTRANGVRCGPPPPPQIPVEVEFPAYEWADPWPFPPTPLALTEVALRNGAFIEVLNVSDAEVALDGFSLRLSPFAPGRPWPTRDEGSAFEWPQPTLAPGARLVVPVPPAFVAPLEADPAFEGVLQLWADGRNYPVERIDFMWWPEAAALTRIPDAHGRHRFCGVTTPGAANDDCAPLESRPLGDRIHHARTPSDLAALGAGGLATGIESVKFVIDMASGDVVHLLDSGFWDLHYRFVRRAIDGLPVLDRCDPEEADLFLTGWRAFSQDNYFEVETRDYLLGTLVRHGGSGLKTLEFTPGDNISSAQMRRAFFTIISKVQDPTEYSLRPQTGAQVERVHALDGQVPAVGPNAPFVGQTYQPLTETIGFGVLRFVPAQDLESASLGAQVIVITDQVPNDIALVGGLITESFQTPLAHVNLLSRNRNTPNMALVDARNDPRLAPLLDRLVRLEVDGADFEIRLADPAEAQAFWESRRPEGPPLSPRSDLDLRGLQELAGRGIELLPAVGAKAAQLGELGRVDSVFEGCPGPLNIPHRVAAIPIVHSLEHYAASGAQARLTALQGDPQFVADPAVRAEGLAEVRALITDYPVDSGLVEQVEAYLGEAYGPDVRVRFRSSSNTEDLPGFNGAGLYTSVSAQLDDPNRRVEDAIRTVWASLFLMRGYDERAYRNVAQDGVAMGVLIHPAFLAERANGVAISRNVLEPIRTDYYFNMQRGEASVTNPSPGVGTDQLIYRRRRRPKISWLARSSLTDGEPVLSEAELDLTACSLRAIHNHFKPLIDPEDDQQWFAMDIEFKWVGDDRVLFIKQARPYSFGSVEVPADCREL